MTPCPIKQSNKKGNQFCNKTYVSECSSAFILLTFYYLGLCLISVSESITWQGFSVGLWRLWITVSQAGVSTEMVPPQTLATCSWPHRQAWYRTSRWLSSQSVGEKQNEFIFHLIELSINTFCIVKMEGHQK